MPKLTETPRANKPNPTFNITEDELPEIKDWKVGQKYSVTLGAELTRLSKGDVFMPAESRKMEATFKVLNAHVSGDGAFQEKPKAGEEQKIEAMKKKLASS
jgi:hypothetical protein